MYESFYGLNEKPFTLLPDPEYLYLSPKHQRALTLLEYGMMNQAGFSVICGDTGAGKTTLIRSLLNELGDETSVGLITNTHQSFGELLNWVLMAFGLDGEGKSKAQMHQLFIEFLIEQYANNKHAVLIVDEAQNMSADTLEELRMLSNINADKDQILQVILAGQPALRETLRKPELMQFAQRIAVDYYLEALNSEETTAYIEHRLQVAGADRQIFTEDACKAIYKYSGGTPRLINLLCDTSLVYGYAEQSEVINVQLVHDVVREQHSSSIIPTFNTNQTDQDNTQKKSAEYSNTEVVAGVAEESAKTYVESAAGKSKEETKNNSKSLQLEEQTIDEEGLNKSRSEETKITESDDIIAELAHRAVQAVTSADSSTVKIHNQSSSSVGHAINSQSIDINDNKEQEETPDKSNVTPINAFQAEIADIKENIELSDEVDIPLETDAKVEEKDENEDENIEALMASVNQDDSDVYPIVHVDENPRKGLSMMVAGMVAGMFIASLSMVAIAWMFLNSNGNNPLQTEQKASEVKEAQQSSERREIAIMQKERDAAIAVSRALERERDAAISAAKIQEQMRAVEQRAAEILAEQERKAEKRLREAQSRARAAERAEAKALKRERQLKLKAEQTKLVELENKRLRLLKEEKQRELELIEQEKLSKRIAQVNNDEIKEAKQIAAPAKVKKASAKKFSANPCNSPSAKFLSTCKK